MLSLNEEYHLFLKLEKALSDNTIEAYELDLQKLSQYLSDAHIEIELATTEVLRDFIIEIAGLGIHPFASTNFIKHSSILSLSDI